MIGLIVICSYFDPVIFWNCSSYPISVFFYLKIGQYTESVMRNHLAITIFIILGLTNDLQLEILVSIFLLVTYMFSVIGNLTIISLIFVDSCFKTAMYFVLQNFFYLEISFTMGCVPKYLYIISSGNKTITTNACFSQISFTVLFGATEFFLLAVMSYDHYVAICKPLHYMTIMRAESWKSYPLLLGIWFLDYPSTPWPESLPGILWLCYWPFFLWCFSNTEEFMFWYMVLRAAGYILCCVDLYSDPCVCSSVLCMYHWMILSLSSAQERKKAFFHVSSHMLVVSIIYGSCIFMYVKPSAKDEVPLIREFLCSLYCCLWEINFSFIPWEINKWSALFWHS